MRDPMNLGLMISHAQCSVDLENMTDQKNLGLADWRTQENMGLTNMLSLKHFDSTITKL
jgi:hypothetical protein